MNVGTAVDRATRRARLRQPISAAAVAVALLLLVSACAQAGGKLQALHVVAKSCPKDANVAAYVALDESGGQRGKQLSIARLTAVRNAATQTATCGGHLKVVAFSASATASVTLFDGDLDPPGATQNARLLRVRKIAVDATDEVERKLPAAQAQLTTAGSDPVAQLEVAREYALQLGAGYRLAALIESSGSIAREKVVPILPGSSVTFAGLGRVGRGRAPSTKQVDGLRAFYESVCRRTRASRCLALTDIALVGGVI